MLIKSEFDVTESPDKVWEFFNNIPLVASCLPGADISEEVAEDQYTGTVVIGVGPVKLNFEGEAFIRERDEANRRLVVEASGADVKGRGQAALNLNAALVAMDGGGTRVHVDQDLHLSGAAAQYGRGLVQDVTAVLLDDFQTNMRGQLAALERGVAFEAAESSASGIAIGLRALRMGLLRVFRRFFLPYQPDAN